MEVEAVDDGKIGQLLVAEGTEGVKVNTPIAEIQDEKVLDTNNKNLESNIVKLTDNLSIEKNLVSNK